jgi:hypothetical protein
MNITSMDSESWIGRTLIDGEDRKLGTIEAIYFDAQTDRPQWMAVKTGLWGAKHSFVPLADATPVDDAIRTPYAQGQVDDAPRFAAAEDLPDDQVAELYRYYGLAYDPPVARDVEVVEVVETVEVVEPDDGYAAPAPATQGERDVLIATGRETEIAGYGAIAPRTQAEEDLLVATGQIVPRRAA